MATGNPPWLDALLAQAYPGVGTDMSAITGVPQGRQGGAEINQQLGGWTAPGADNYSAGGGIGSDARFPSTNVDERLLPAAPASANARNPYSPPVPNPNRVGGAPSPGIPAPQRANRTANNPPINPNFSLVQYSAPNSQGGRAPIYTAGNFGGPQNAGWGQPQAGSPSQTPPAGAPAGALAPPQGGYNVNSLFANLPNDIFDQGSQSGGPMPPAAVAQLMQHHPGYISASPDQLSTYMKNNPWVQNLGG